MRGAVGDDSFYRDRFITKASHAITPSKQSPLEAPSRRGDEALISPRRDSLASGLYAIISMLRHVFLSLLLLSGPSNRGMIFNIFD